MGNAAAAKKMMMLGVRENPGFDFKQPTIVQLQGVIPGRCEASNPESRDSGSGPSDRPGMTLCVTSAG
jgi:hypothetical protein